MKGNLREKLRIPAGSHSLSRFEFDVIQPSLQSPAQGRNVRFIFEKLDIGYKIDGQSIIIHKIRRLWNDSSKFIYPEVAKQLL